jgi:hypothetical protein
MNETWRCTDPRDEANDLWRFRLYTPDEISELNAGFVSLLYLLAVPAGDFEHAQVLERIVTDDVKRTARTLLRALAGKEELPDDRGKPDPDRARNLRNRRGLVERDHGPCEIRLAVHYDQKIRATAVHRPRPTAAMVQLVSERLATAGYARHRWTAIQTIRDLPRAPHDRAVLLLVGIDATGKLDGSLPRPNPQEIDQHGGRNLPALMQGTMDHPLFREAIAYCQQRTLFPLFAWRFDSRP